MKREEPRGSKQERVKAPRLRRVCREDLKPTRRSIEVSPTAQLPPKIPPPVGRTPFEYRHPEPAKEPKRAGERAVKEEAGDTEKRRSRLKAAIEYLVDRRLSRQILAASPMTTPTPSLPFPTTTTMDSTEF